MRYFLSLLLASFSVIQVCAQDKLSSPAKDTIHRSIKNDTSYHISFAGTGSINKAINDITYLFNNDLNFGVDHEKFSLNFDNNWVYGTDHHTKTNNDFLSVLQMDWNKPKAKPGFYYWALASYNTSYSLKVNNQVLAGAGIAYSLINDTTNHLSLSLSDGPVYDYSDLVLPDSTHVNYSTLRNSFRLHFHFEVKKGLIALDGVDFLQNSFKGADYIIRSVTTLSLKLNKWLDLTSSLNYNEQRRTESSNLIFTYGFRVGKRF